MPLLTNPGGGTGGAAYDPTLAANRAVLNREFCRPNQWQYDWDWGQSVVSGSGAVSSTNFGVNCQTGATAGSRAQRQLGFVVSDIFLNAPNGSSTALNFSKPFTVGFAFNPVSVSTNGQFFLKLGRGADSTGPLANKGFGIRLNNTTLVAQVHDGTTLTTSATLKTVTAAASQITWVVLQSDGAGNVAVYIDDVLAVTMTGGPSADDSGGFGLVAEALNNADASSTRIHVSPLKIATQP